MNAASSYPSSWRAEERRTWPVRPTIHILCPPLSQPPQSYRPTSCCEYKMPCVCVVASVYLSCGQFLTNTFGGARGECLCATWLQSSVDNNRSSSQDWYSTNFRSFCLGNQSLCTLRPMYACRCQKGSKYTNNNNGNNNNGNDNSNQRARRSTLSKNLTGRDASSPFGP